MISKIKSVSLSDTFEGVLSRCFRRGVSQSQLNKGRALWTDLVSWAPFPLWWVGLLLVVLLSVNFVNKNGGRVTLCGL